MGAALKNLKINTYKTIDLSLVEKLVVSVNAGDFNDTLLQAVAVSCGGPKALGKYLNGKIDTAFQECSGCHELFFSVNLKRAYAGLQYVCVKCAAHYEHCRECRSLVLKADTILHIHAKDLQSMLPPPGQELAKWNAKFPKILKFYAPEQTPSPTTRLFGIELEVEKAITVPVPPDLTVKCLKILPEGFAMVKRDGSLSAAPGQQKKGTNGFEIVSMPASRKFHTEYAGWQRLLSMLAPFSQDKPVTAGLHVHVGLASIQAMTAAKVNTFINHQANFGFLTAVADRDFTLSSPNHPKGGSYCPIDGIGEFGDQTIRSKMSQIVSCRTHTPDCPRHPTKRKTWQYYCNPKTKSIMHDALGIAIISQIDGIAMPLPSCHCPPGLYTFSDHYAAFNLLTKQQTVEFRLFQASNNPTHFFACLEFCDAILDYCDQAHNDELTARHFLAWYRRGQRRIYPHLTDWLIQTDYLTRSRRRD